MPSTAYQERGPAATGRREFVQRLRTWLQPQVSIGAREQRDQAVLLLAVAVIVAPHFPHLPLWSIAAIGAMWVWRAWLTQTLKPAPGRLVMVVLLVLGTAAVWAEHGTLFGRDPSVNFLLVLIGLKVLEMRAHRDVLVIVFLSFFVLQTQFLFDQGMATAAIMVTAVSMLFFVLLSVNLPEGDISFRGKVRYLVRVFLYALPLTLVLFFLFPRLPGPVWRSGGGEQVAGTGLSDSMSPGTVGELMRNEAVALRAKFDQNVPEQRSLYWRGPVFGLFDGRNWTALAQPRIAAGAIPQVHTVAASAVRYTVTLEPTQRHELIALEFAADIDDVPTISSRLTPTLELQTGAPVSGRLRYRARSYTSFVIGPTADDGSQQAWLQLPPGYNPRALRWAADLKARMQSDAPVAGPRAPGQVDQRLVNAVLAHFHREPFRYSIDAPLLGRDSVDEFFFDRRVGFCEHYASSFVVLMRAMGIPSRVVTGYQGGEVNPVDGYLTVRQSDAHAWAEVWLQNRGWIRVDPTAAVAPERIERSSRERSAEELSGAQGAWPWLRRIRLNGEAMENLWNQWFLSYSAERQRTLVSWIGLQPSLENISAVALAAFGTLLLLLAIGSLRRRVTRDPLAEVVFQLRAKLARAGVQIPPNMGLQDMERHLAGTLDAACLPQMRHLLAAIGAARYARPALRARSGRARKLRAQLRQWRPIRAVD